MSYGKNTFDDQMRPSFFRVPEEAVSIARKMLDPECSESYDDLRKQFMQNIPTDKWCFFGIDGHNANHWNKVKAAGYLVAFDPGDDLVAVISMDEVLHKEDFAAMMKVAGMDTTEGNFTETWFLAWENVLSGASLRDGFMTAFRTVHPQNVFFERE